MTQDSNGGPKSDSGYRTNLEAKFPQLRAWPGKEPRMKSIAAALVKAQKAFGPALKTNTNPHFRSKYADLSACVEAVIDALNANGIALIQRTHECENGVMVETVFVHESGETMDCGKLHVPAPKHDPQGYGSALTYARRYSLMAACGIAPEDDDGNAAKAKIVPETFRSSATMGAIDELEPKEREYVEGLADRVNELARANRWKECVELVEGEELIDTHAMALWSLLDSKTRAAYKKAKQGAKEAQPA